jgi:hypothetical protein
VWLAALVFLVFHRFFVLAIMGSHQRFYYPVLPAALFLSIQVVVCVAQLKAPQRWTERLAASSRMAWSAGAVLLVLAIASLLPRAWSAVASLRSTPRLQNMTVLENYRHNWPSGYWIRLDAFSQLPDDLVIATTEVGYPGVLNPRKRIVDLAGLNDTHFAKHGFTAANLFERYQPDLFLLPRSHYAAMRGALIDSPEFRSGYEVFRPPQGLVMALRRDSQHYPAMRRVLGLP